MDIGDRIKAIRKQLQINQTDFANQIGLTQTTLSMLESGKNTLTDKNIKLICSVFHISESWLRNGEGEMFSSSPYIKEFSEIFEGLLPETQQFLLSTANQLLSLQYKLLSQETDESNEE
ncbi:helix-turn-helix domain-containing protein [Harryflintia acetispora]|uniref:DNA-binding XRE family transcriptional regulator n=1 Tax=Harryflintia acetispora TaxID=1849041 RepID=A0A9X8ULI5_9FIRM|nr:helix-turn-helix transcriptional regulator [Harryflintia acetispora]TCL45404.1 DNA-binding XRE family transcriptional regulator [Harryflintia acetispora]